MKQIVLLGGYTRKSGKGIYRAEFDDQTGKLTTPKPYVTELGSPTYMAVSEANIAYAVDAGDGVGGLAAIDLNQNPPVVIGTDLDKGGSPAHVSIDEKRQLVFASFYHDGKVKVYDIRPNHVMRETVAVTHHGKGPRPEQDASHVHFAQLTPDGNRLAVIDLGMDEVVTYPIQADGTLTTPAILKLEPGFGPRHLVFHPTLPIAYLLGELSSQVAVLEYDKNTGKFTQGQTQSTIPEDWTEHNGAAAVRISTDGKFLYLSNRGHNSIVVYAVSKDGLTLTEIQTISTEGEFPRDFNLDLSEHYLLVANQNTDNATLYKRDAKSGELTVAQKDIPAPEAVNVVFLKAE